MEFNNYSTVREYVETHSIEEMLVVPLNNQDLIYSCNISAVSNIKKKIEMLNEVTKEKYSVLLGDTIQAEVTDIKVNLKKYNELHSSLADEASCDTLVNILAYRLTREEKYILKAYNYESEQYFDPAIVKFRNGCVYADCGALDGLTTAEFIVHCQSYSKIYMYEPMECYYNDCSDNIKKLKAANIYPRQYAVYENSTVLKFNANIRGNSQADASGNIEVNAVSLDEDIKEPLGFIKMDIEGSEKSAIKGARKHIANDSPMLAICVYHMPSDLWEIPSMIKAINPNYDSYLRHHSSNYYETVFYAVPKNALQSENCDGVSSISMETELECRKFIDSVHNVEEKRLLAQHVDNRLVISSLQDWVSQLEEAKLYYLSQINNLEGIINPHDKKGAEQTREELLVENRKLRFYLKEEIRKPWYKKLLNRGSLNNYLNQINNSED